MKFHRPCLTCGALSRETRCPTHQRQRLAEQEARRSANPARIAKKRNLYNYAYQQQRKELEALVRSGLAVCHLCGKPIAPTDPFNADHLQAGSSNSPLAPTHPFCNQSRGNKPL